MTKLELKLLTLARSAANFVEKQGLPIPTYAALPAWPAEDAFPVQRVEEPESRIQIQPDSLYRAVALRQVHDPDEKCAWAFVPSPDRSAVWLVRTRQINASLN